MKPALTLTLFLPLLVSSCYTVGVEVTDEAMERSIGMTEDELLELYGVPHVSSIDSEGVKLIAYGLEHRYGFTLDAETFVEFTLLDGRVTKTRRVFSRPIADKNRAR